MSAKGSERSYVAVGTHGSCADKTAVEFDVTNEGSLLPYNGHHRQFFSELT
jgi:hypothetical protein